MYSVQGDLLTSLWFIAWSHCSWPRIALLHIYRIISSFSYRILVQIVHMHACIAGRIIGPLMPFPGMNCRFILVFCCRHSGNQPWFLLFSCLFCGTTQCSLDIKASIQSLFARGHYLKVLNLHTLKLNVARCLLLQRWSFASAADRIYIMPFCCFSRKSWIIKLANHGLSNFTLSAYLSGLRHFQFSSGYQYP